MTRSSGDKKLSLEAIKSSRSGDGKKKKKKSMTTFLTNITTEKMVPIMTNEYLLRSYQVFIFF